MRPVYTSNDPLAGLPVGGYVEIVQDIGAGRGGNFRKQFLSVSALVGAAAIDTFAELDALVTDESLVNVDMINTFAELDAIVADETLLAATSVDTLAKLNALVGDATFYDQSVRLGKGAGLTDGSGALVLSSVVQEGEFIRTKLFLDITDLKASTTDLDIIGVEGADVVVNGAFAADTDWTKGADWSIAAGVATAAPGTGTVLEPEVALTVEAGATYEVTYTMSGFVAGTCTVSIGGQDGTARGSDATFVERIVASDTTNLKFTSDAAADYDIDDVIVKKVSPAFIGPFDTTVVGTLHYGEVRCLEVPAGATLDIDFYAADEASGLFDDAVTGLVETALLTKGGNWAAAAETWFELTALPADDQYFYLTAGAGAGAGTYTGGQWEFNFIGS